jgi:hypothetical protein
MHDLNLLDKESSMAIQPNKIIIPLKSHQKTSLHSMLKKERDFTISINIYDNKVYRVVTNIGINGDNVGSGKTLEMLSLIASSRTVKDYRDVIGDEIMFKNIVYNKKNIDEKKIDSNLIVVPHDLFHQWSRSIKRDTTLKALYVSNIKDVELFNINSLDYDLVLCNANKYNDIARLSEDYKWNRLIFDEADTINIPNNMKISANFLWFITTTYNRIKYHRNNGFIKGLFNNLRKTLGYSLYNLIIGSSVVKNSDEHVKLSFKLPDPKNKFIKCQTPINIKIVHDCVPRIVLQMLNAGNIKGAINSLKCRVDTDESIVKVYTKSLREQIIHSTSETEIVKLKKRLKILKNRMLSLDYCPICMDKVKRPAALLGCCKHKFCMDCLVKSLSRKNRCPLCRKNITPESDISIMDYTLDKIEHNTQEYSKIDTLISIIQNKKKGKFLIFSSYYDSFYSIVDRLKIEKISYAKLAGNGHYISKTIERYIKGEISVLLLNARHYGSGLNLQMATDMVIYHKLDRETEQQVIGRAQRVGRDSYHSGGLTINHLYYDHEAL